MVELETPRSTRTSPRFTLAALFGFTTLCAIVCGIVVAFGFVPGVGAVVILSVVPLGVMANRADREFQYWQCIGSLLIACLLVPMLAPTANESEFGVVLEAVVIGAGTSLALAAVLRGHWTTRLLAGLMLSLYLLLLVGVIGTARWAMIADYWWG